MKIYNKFKLWLEGDFNYISIGHDYKNFDTWTLRRNAKELTLGSKSGQNPEFLHDNDDGGRIDYKGRVDYNKKMVSITSDYFDPDRLKYVVGLLKMEYPGYALWLFGRGSPKEIY